jgi:hypothetical protein
MTIVQFILITSLVIGLGGLGWTPRLFAQGSKPQDNAAAKSGEQPPARQQDRSAQAYSGMYTFLKDGEFVQVTVEDDGRVTGFISRFGDSESDKGAFLDQFFKSGKIEGNKLTFTTQVVHGVAFDFKGSAERGEGKDLGDEAYFVLKGTLTQNTTDADKKVTSHSQEVVFKLFPRDAAPTPAARQ